MLFWHSVLARQPCQATRSPLAVSAIEGWLQGPATVVRWWALRSAASSHLTGPASVESPVTASLVAAGGEELKGHRFLRQVLGRPYGGPKSAYCVLNSSDP